MVLPNEGMSPEAIFSHLDELQHDDVRWRDGRVFSLVYYGGADVLAVAEEAYRRYSTENALEHRRVSWVAHPAGRRRRVRRRMVGCRR